MEFGNIHWQVVILQLVAGLGGDVIDLLCDLVFLKRGKEEYERGRVGYVDGMHFKGRITENTVAEKHLRFFLSIYYYHTLFYANGASPS
jgi:hypothetical protein